ncbi:DUF5988 family protein [Streptomyces microflavus]|uniref:DUF5988 family protein n=1 Tax=Streptomyces microflavus TaxID=1919 RepID=UPI0037CDC0CE
MLTGGPEGLDPFLRIDDAVLPDRVALRHLNGYEHFERSGHRGEVPVYRWIYSTKIAE